jgi:hypothetical protein
MPSAKMSAPNVGHSENVLWMICPYVRPVVAGFSGFTDIL